MLEHFSKGNGSASALAQRRVLNDLGVASQSGAPSAAAGVRAAGPLSGRRSVSTKPAAPRVGGKPGGGGGKVSDGDLLTSMVQRLNGLERKMAEQRNLLVEKDAEVRIFRHFLASSWFAFGRVLGACLGLKFRSKMPGGYGRSRSCPRGRRRKMMTRGWWRS